jgi:Sulfotransferase domain
VGDQRRGELLLAHYVNKDFGPLVEFCRSAQVFQDSPFSFPETFKHLDAAFPGSKFILSVRDSSEQWYNSLIRFHSKLSPGRIPTVTELQNADYVYKGWMWQAHHAVFNTPDDDPYNKEILIGNYERHNRDVIEYFKGRDTLLIINVSQTASYRRFCKFIGADPLYDQFPWENKTI